MHDADATASARLSPVGGSGVDGAIRFLKYGEQVVVRVKVDGLPPYRDYGLHVHEGRSCADDASGIGGHFNPGNAAHGRPTSGTHHAGDLPNLRAEADGNAAYSFDTSALTIGPGPTSVIGRVVVISSNADDFKTQPDGNSGKPLACGFVRLDGRAFGAPLK
jgi:Cu-Zn family superoxide dismutase